MIDEANLFCDWYVKNNLPNNQRILFNKRFKRIISKLSLSLKLNNNVFVHRDFHVSNMMYFKNMIFLIDSQDAVYGNNAYDLASLIDDVRIKTTNREKEKIFLKYTKMNTSINLDDFRNDFEILSVLRNLKIIGIFTRLSVRDKKNKYLKLIPYAWKLIEQRLKKNPNFYDLKEVLRKYFSNRVRKKYEN